MNEFNEGGVSFLSLNFYPFQISCKSQRDQKLESWNSKSMPKIFLVKSPSHRLWHLQNVQIKLFHMSAFIELAAENSIGPAIGYSFEDKEYWIDIEAHLPIIVRNQNPFRITENRKALERLLKAAQWTRLWAIQFVDLYSL